MRPKQQQKARHDDLFRARLDQIINMNHALVALADKIDWAWLDEQLAVRFSDKGRPAEPVRFMIGMFLLKHTYGLSDEQVWERWVHDPYFQYFTGEEFFQHDLPHERWHEPLEEPHRRSPGHPFGRKPAYRRCHRRLEEERPGPRHHRHHGTAEERRLPDRR